MDKFLGKSGSNARIEILPQHMEAFQANCASLLRADFHELRQGLRSVQPIPPATSQSFSPCGLPLTCCTSSNAVRCSVAQVIPHNISYLPKQKHPKSLTLHVFQFTILSTQRPSQMQLLLHLLCAL